MLTIVKSELLKLWMKKSFWGILIVLVSVNLLLLWYTENNKADAPPPSAYTKLASDISGMGEEEKLGFIEEKLQRLTAVGVWNEIISIEIEAGPDNEYAAGLIQQMKDDYSYLDQYKAAHEAKSYLRYTQSLESETAFITGVFEEITRVSGYPELLSDIEKQAARLSKVSIFGGEDNDSFSGRNILKTAGDYKGMESVSIEYGMSKGFTAATDFLITDVIAILIMLLLSTLMIYHEKDKGLFALVKSTARGRGTTIAAKIGALCVNMMLITFLLFGVNMIYSGIIYGFSDFSHSLQSVPAFLGSTWGLNIGQYLLLFLASKFTAYFTLALFVFFIALLSKHPAITYLSAGAVLLASYAVYETIPAISNLNVFKFINLISFVRSNGLYRDYLNLNIFEQPVSVVLSVWIAITVTFILCLTACYLVFCKKKNMQSGELPFKKWFGKITLFRYKPSAIIFKYESYKLLIVNKVALLLIVFVLFQWHSNRDAKFYTAYDEPFYLSYMTELEGALTPEKQEFIEKEQIKYEEAEQAVTAINALVESGELTFEQADITALPYKKILLGQPMFERVLERYEYVKGHPGAEFIYDTGYNRLFGLSPNNDSFTALMLILLCVICFSSLFPMEYKTGAVNLVSVTPLGKAVTNKKKILVSITAFLPFFIAAYLPDILLLKDYFVSLNAPIMSLPAFSHLPSFLPVWGYMILLYATRFLACGIILLSVLAISKLMKNNIYAMLTESAVFAAPVVLWMMKLSFMYRITLLPLLTSNDLYMGSFSMLSTILYVIVPVILGVFGTFLCV